MTAPLTVAVDASPVRAGTGGVGRYVADLIAHLPDDVAGRPLRILPLTNRTAEWRAWLDEGRRTGSAPIAAPRPFLRRPTLAWLQWDAARHARRPSVALFHATTGRAQIGFGQPFIVTVHDTAVLDAPGLFPYRERWLAGLSLRASVPRAAAVLCVSRATADAVRRRWPTTAGRLHVIPPGANGRWLAPPSALPELLAAAVGRRWWLHVGACSARKNVVRLVEAFARVHRLVGEPPPVLAFVGPRGDADRRVHAAAAALGVADRVRLVGSVDDAALHALYAGAELTACVGLHEGFGLPALEALASGCPVVSSGRGGLLDAAPRGAVVADPTDGDALEAALIAVATDDARRSRLAAEGRAHARGATWHAAAAATARAYAAVAGSR